MADSQRTEQWRSVVGYEGILSVSDMGRVRRDKTGRVYSGSVNCAGYVRISFRRMALSVQKMVMDAFCGPAPYGQEINHKNFNRSDNRLENLEYMTHAENVRYSISAGRYAHKIDQSDVDRIRQRCISGEPYGPIALEYRVSTALIGKIARGRYRHNGIAAVAQARKRHSSKISQETVELVRSLRVSGKTYREIILISGVGHGTVARCLRS